MPSLRSAYLLTYNAVQAAGWAVALYQVLAAAIPARSLTAAYSAAGDTVALFQAISALEILHAALRIAGGSPVSALMQWAGRSNVLFGVVRAVPQVQSSTAVGVMLLAWALSEVVRYPWYAATTAGACPYWLTWLRYTAFIPLYPAGLLGEMHAVYQALPEIAARGLRSVAMPNPWNFAFTYSTFLKGLLMVYPFLWWQLYSMLLQQRKKRLAPASTMAKKQQ